VRVADVVHGHPEDLPAAVSGLLSTDSRTLPAPSIAACLTGSARTAKMASAGALMIVVALTVSSVMLTASVGLLPPAWVERGEEAVTSCRSGSAPHGGWLDAWTSALAGWRGSTASRQGRRAAAGDGGLTGARRRDRRTLGWAVTDRCLH
jgi:hypothetical protein